MKEEASTVPAVGQNEERRVCFVGSAGETDEAGITGSTHRKTNSHGSPRVCRGYSLVWGIFTVEPSG